MMDRKGGGGGGTAQLYTTANDPRGQIMDYNATKGTVTKFKAAAVLGGTARWNYTAQRAGLIKIEESLKL